MENTHTQIHTYLSLYHLHTWYPRKPEECNRSPGQGFRSSSKPSDVGSSIQTWVPNSSFTTEEIPDSQICYYSVEDEDVPVLLLLSLTS